MFAVEERIQAPVDQVWEYLRDPDKMSDWMESVDAMSIEGGGEMRLGATLSFEARGARRTTEVIEFSEGQSLSLRSTQGPITAIYRYSLAPDAAATRARLEADCTAKGWGKLIAPIIRILVRRIDGRQMQNLKAAVERAASS